MHLFENIHSALEELRRLGEYKIVYWNCKSVRAFRNGEIDFNYIPKKPDEFYIDELYLNIERDPESDGLIAYYRFRLAKLVHTPVEEKLWGVILFGNAISTHDTISSSIELPLLLNGANY